MKPEISILIPVKNEANLIAGTIKSILAQKIDSNFEIIVVDSGSTDGTLEIIKSFPQVKLLEIKSEEFGHGKTRNLLASKAAGEYLVFLNADAWPVNDTWLKTLIDDLKNNRQVAGVFSRHLPREDCSLTLARAINRGMGKKKIIKAVSAKKASAKDIFFSTVSAAIKKDVFVKIPFRDVLIAEDQLWSYDALKAGYSIIYEPKSLVYHSHNYNFRQIFTFAYQSRQIWNKILPPKSKFLSSLYFVLRFFILFLTDLIAVFFSKLNLKRKLLEIWLAFGLGLAGLAGEIMGTFRE